MRTARTAYARRLDAEITPAMRRRAKTDLPKRTTRSEADVIALGDRVAQALAFDNHPLRPFRLNVVRARGVEALERIET